MTDGVVPVEALVRAARRFGTPVGVTSVPALAAAAAELRDAFPDPWLRAFSLKANDVPAVVARLGGLGLDANVVSSRRVGRGAHGRAPERADHAGRGGQVGGGPAGGGACLRRGGSAALGGRRECRRAGCARRAGAARRPGPRRPAGAGRAAAAEPRRAPGDPGGAGGRSQVVQVRHDRHGADGGRRGTPRRRTGACPWDPPACRVAAGCRGCLAGRGPARARDPGAAPGRAAGIRHVRRRWRVPGRRPGHGPVARTVRRRGPGAARSDPRRPTTGAPRRGARAVPRCLGRVDRRVRAPRPRARRRGADRGPGRGDDGAGAADAVRGGAPGRRTHVAGRDGGFRWIRVGRAAQAGRWRCGTSPADPRGRSRLREHGHLRAVLRCRRCAAATSWRSARPAPTRHRWPRPTTDGRRSPRSCSRRTGRWSWGAAGGARLSVS